MHFGAWKSPAQPEAPKSSPERPIDCRLLFVGCDPGWFGQIERELLVLEPAWMCQLVNDAAGAASAIGSASFDGVVLDGGIAGAAGVAGKLVTPTGRMVCLARCDVADRATVTEWNRLGVQPFAADASAVELSATLKRTRRLREWMADPAVKKLLPLLRKLPAEPGLHSQVTAQLESPDASIQTVAVLISQDPVMSAKILQVVNSAFFGMTQQVTDTAEAVMVLGTERIRSLILLAGVFSQYGDVKCSGFSPELIWGHSIQVAMLARGIAFEQTKDTKTAETAFTAGLLHDIGKLVLACNVPAMYDTVQRMQVSKKISLCEAEHMVLGVTHAELGGCLLGTWGLPLPILEAIAWHHEPQRSKDVGFSVLTAVHVANSFALEPDPGNGEGAQARVNFGFLARSGLDTSLNRWRAACGIAGKQEEETLLERIRRRREGKEN